LVLEVLILVMVHLQHLMEILLLVVVAADILVVLVVMEDLEDRVVVLATPDLVVQEFLDKEILEE
jgi:hypothetical protein